MIERQELYCHDCGKYVQFNLDLSLNGNHVLNCPNCGHEHCRVVKDGKITGERWDQGNGQTTAITACSITYTAASTWDTTTSGSSFSYGQWMSSSSIARAT